MKEVKYLHKWCSCETHTPMTDFRGSVTKYDLRHNSDSIRIRHKITQNTLPGVTFHECSFLIMFMGKIHAFSLICPRHTQIKMMEMKQKKGVCVTFGCIFKIYESGGGWCELRTCLFSHIFFKIYIIALQFTMYSEYNLTCLKSILHSLTLTVTKILLDMARTICHALNLYHDCCHKV